MIIAVFLDGEIESGGGFHCELSVSKIIQKYSNEKYVFKFFVSSESRKKTLDFYGLNVSIFKNSLWDKILRNIKRNLFIYTILKKLNLHLNNIDKVLIREKIDLVYFLSPSEYCIDLSIHNYIFTLWDLCHRDFVEFPEVKNFKEFERREELYTKYLKKAIAVIAESELGKQNLINRYSLDENRLNVETLFFSESVKISNEDQVKYFIDIKNKYNFQLDYIFYPAQFWSHKNHIYILKALKILKDKYNQKIMAVFSGSDKGNLNFILKKAKYLGIEDQIRYIGFVDALEIPFLYKQAIALVMPTYFGPSNIPPLEAFELSCPVCYSDLPGLREQVGDAGWLMDLKNPESLVNILIEIQNDKVKVKDKILLGKKILEKQSPEKFWSILKNILDDFEIKRDCWE